MTLRHLTLAAVLVLAVAWLLLPSFTVTLLNYIGLYALVAVGLVMLTGVGGMTSFGQAAFVGLGAYASAWLCTSPLAAQALGGLPPALLPWLGLAAGLVVTLLVAWLLGAVTLPLSGHFLALATLAWGISLYFIFGNAPGLGGFTGISNIPALSLGGWQLRSSRLYGILIWALLLLAIWALHNLLDSNQGRALRALRSNRIMAESVGVDTGRARMRLFLIAALLAALSGWLYVHFQRFVNPTPFNLDISIEYLFMAVVGGSGHLWGGVLGAALITLLKQQLQDVLPHLLGNSGNFELVAFGLLMLLVMQRAPSGLWPLLTRACGRFLRQAPPSWRKARPAVLPERSRPQPGTLVLEARAISKAFGGLLANDAVDLTLRAGEIHALIGPNGAGKSTFFNLISGVDHADGGSLHVAGQAMVGQPPRAFARLGMARTFQHVRLLRQRPVLDNVCVGAYLRGRRGWLAAMLRRERDEEHALLAEAQRQLARCGLAADATRPAGALPLGRQRLVEIARALAGDPLILLLDEPAAGLRSLEKRELARLLAELRAAGLALLIVEHDMGFVMNLADRVTVLEFGCVIASGPPQQVQADPRVVAAYLGADDEDELQPRPAEVDA